MSWARASSWACRGWTAACVMVALGALWFSAQAQVTNDAPTSPAQVVVAGEAAAREFVRSHRTELSFGLNRVEALQGNLLGVPRWEYLATLAYLVLAFGFAKGIDVLVKTRLRAWASRTETQWDDVLVGLADGPVKAVVFVILLNVGLQLFD